MTKKSVTCMENATLLALKRQHVTAQNSQWWHVVGYKFLWPCNLPPIGQSKCHLFIYTIY